MGHVPQLRETDSIRLDSWKEIATFLRRDARTVRRWERDRRLPVHRVPGGERSGVFAYTSELESWLHAAGPIADDTVRGAVKTIALMPKKIDSGAGAAQSPEEQSAADASEEAAISLSAFHCINSFDGAFATDIPETSDGSEQVDALAAGAAVAMEWRLKPRILKRFRLPLTPGYRAGLLCFFLAIAIGLPVAVVHHRTADAIYRPTPEAQELYLRGRYYWNLRTEDGLTAAVDLFTQSIVNDPKYAAAYAGLADSYLLLRQYGQVPNTEAYPRALAAVRQAVALDDSSPDAHRALAFILRFWNWDMAAAEKEYKRAIALKPNDSQSHHWYATALLSSGRTREALVQIDLARALEPQSVSVLADRGLILSMIEPQRGLANLQQLEKTQPEFRSIHSYLAGIYLGTGDYAGFLTESRLAAEPTHDAETLAILERAREVLSSQGAQPMLDELARSLAALADRGTIPAYPVAQLFAHAGERNGAIRYLRLSCDRREPGFLELERERAFNLIRSLPEYPDLVAKGDAASGRMGSQRQLYTP